MRSILLTGANRGIGLEFIKQLINLKPNAPNHIFAVCRDVENAEELKNLAKEAEQNGCSVRLMQHDVTDFAKIDSLVEEVDKVVGSDGLNVLINNAGVLPPRDGLSDLSTETLLRTYEINTVSPAIYTKKFWPLLKRAAANQKDGTLRADKAAVFNISSLMGSIGDCSSGGVISYRCSKSALNMLTRCASIDMRADEILVAAFSPGSVKTAMTNFAGRLDSWESVSGMIDTMLKLNETHNGKFVNFESKLQPY